MRGGVRSPPRGTGTLELAFDSKSLRAVCENEAHAQHELGMEAAEVLKHRLADLVSATSVEEDLVAGSPRVLEGTDDRCMAVDLCGGYRMVFCANHPKNPTGPTGKIDWLKVSRIKILRIEKDDVQHPRVSS